MKNYIDFILSLIVCAKDIWRQCESRDKNLIVILAVLVPISAALAGYALFTTILFLIGKRSIAYLLGATGFLMMYMHDRTLIATEKTHQIISKLVLSIFLAVGFTIVHNANENYEILEGELIQLSAEYNSDITADMNAELEKIETEKKEIMQRIEKAAAIYQQNRQPLFDARRSMEAFLATEQGRKDRIREVYEPRFRQPSITNIDIMAFQSKKIFSGSKESLVGLIMAFFFFTFEALPVLLRILLNQGDYMTRFAARLQLKRDLRDQQNDIQSDFIAKDSDLISNMMELEIVSKKADMLDEGFEDMNAMAALDYRKKFLDAGYNPYTGQKLDEFDPEQFIAEPAKIKTSDNGAIDPKKNGHIDDIPVFNP